ncbi:MAG: hypothetical protein HY904_12935 [Deltaproteobacteria bacterium]|nr:hypothetical protein [Deltaproteobacteria bacterium]
MRWLRTLCLAVLSLWLVPQAAVLVTDADTCTSACPDDRDGDSCPPLCGSCACNLTATRITSAQVTVAHEPLSHANRAWWPERSPHTDHRAGGIFHPPRA